MDEHVTNADFKSSLLVKAVVLTRKAACVHAFCTVFLVAVQSVETTHDAVYMLDVLCQSNPQAAL